jgi:ubiquitin-protein ligase
MQQSQHISRDNIKRLIHDIKQIIKNPLDSHGIYYKHDDENMLKGYALIIGQKNTPYFGGNYLFEFDFPTNYPYSPPVVTYHTNKNKIRFNPNLYVCGKVCISILNTWEGDQWSSCLNISTILLNICTILCENPLLNEPGISFKQTKLIKTYNDIIHYSNINIAICDILNKTVHNNFFNHFTIQIHKHFIDNYDELIKIVNDKKPADSNVYYTLKFPMYKLTNVDIEYTKLKDKLQNCYKSIKQI